MLAVLTDTSPAAEEIYLLDETAVLLLLEWFTLDFLYHILLL